MAACLTTEGAGSWRWYAFNWLLILAVGGLESFPPLSCSCPPSLPHSLPHSLSLSLSPSFSFSVSLSLSLMLSVTRSLPSLCLYVSSKAAHTRLLQQSLRDPRENEGRSAVAQGNRSQKEGRSPLNRDHNATYGLGFRVWDLEGLRFRTSRMWECKASLLEFSYPSGLFRSEFRV